MGLITRLLRVLFLRDGLTNLTRAGTGVIDAMRPNATRQLELGHDAFSSVQAEHAAEFRNPRGGYFDSFVNGLNRLPRPMLALGTLSLFIYAMLGGLCRCAGKYVIQCFDHIYAAWASVSSAIQLISLLMCMQ